MTRTVPQLDIDAEVQRLRGFEMLPPDWNSYGAKTISHIAVCAAIDLLTHIARAFDARPDFIAPVANGGVHLEWSGADAEIEVRVNPDNTFAYLYTHGEIHREKHGVPMDEVIAAVANTLAD